MITTSTTSPAETIFPDRLAALVAAYVFQNPGQRPEDLVDRLNMLYETVEKMWAEEVKEEKRVDLLTGWCEYKLGVRPRDMVHPDLLRELP